ncbi:MAG: zinc ABC transporter substrate-binding protein [Thermomicrobiales bacterium]|nr:zinc ABC transporter substrate-binding protein [Thermomicrobiales bacterium]
MIDRTNPSAASLSRRRALAMTGAAVAGAVAHRLEGISAQETARAVGWSDELGSNDLLNVATTVAPISSIVRNIGGNRINLRGIVPDGVNSHTFEPAPSDAVILSNADVLIANGLDLEVPTIELAEANLPAGAEVFTLGDKVITPEEYAYDFSFPEEEGHPNPHLWTNIPYAMEYARLVEQKLSELDPDNADYFAANLELYLARLEELDAAIQATVDTIPEENRKLLTYHDSWAYFAPTYGMTVIGAIQPSDFSEPSPREVADLIDQIREEEVPAIFGSEVFPSPVLEQIASEGGAEYYDDLRDDEPPGEPGAPEHTFIGMMLRNLEIMANALGGDPSALASVSAEDTFVS